MPGMDTLAKKLTEIQPAMVELFFTSEENLTPQQKLALKKIPNLRAEYDKWHAAIIEQIGPAVPWD